MSDNLEPRPGDVWESPRGTIVFIFKSDPDILSAIEMFGGTASIGDIDDFPNYTLRFRDGKPVPQPQPQLDGETATLECAVTIRKSGRFAITGLQGASANDVAAELPLEQFCGVVPVALPVSLRSVSVLPTVNVTGQ